MDKTNNLSKCTQHNLHVLNMLQLLSKCESTQICLMHVNQFKIEEYELISIEEKINSSTQTIFKNFTPLKDQAMQEKLNKVSEEIMVLERVQENIKINLSQFRQRVNQMLSLIEEKTYAQLNHLQDLKNNLVDVYNKISSKNELKNLLLDSKEENSKFINLLIEQKIIDKDINKGKIRKQLLDFEEAFKLVNEQDKDIKLLHNYMLSYCEKGNEFDMNKIIKGGQLHLNIKFQRNRTLEVRIHLTEKIFQIANYPKYDGILRDQLQIQTYCWHTLQICNRIMHLR